MRDYKAEYQRSKERIKQNVKTWRKSNPEKERNRIRRGVLRKYGMTLKQYETMIEKSGGVCAICQQTSKYTLVVDHCHKTDKIRGLLCRKCNSGLGFFGDNRINIARALGYLQWAEKTKKKTVSLTRISD